MTGHEQLEEDLRRARRSRILVVAAAIAVCMVAAAGLVGAAIANIVNVGQGNDITQIQKSPCTADPDGKECQTTKKRSDEAASLPTLCVQFQRVDLEGRLLRLTRCPDEDLTRRHRVPEGGDASQSPSTATQQHAPAAAPGHQGGIGTSSHTSSRPPTSPSSSPASSGETGSPAGPGPTSSTSSSSSTTTVTEGSAAATEPQPEQPVGSAVGGLVEEVGSTTTGAVEGVTGTACTLAKLLCP